MNSQCVRAWGVELIVLSEHVDYWDSLGWKDPFSDARFSERQSDYGGRVYTPQAVVDGRIDVLGSDERAIVTAVTSAARQPHGLLRLAPAEKRNGKIHFSAGRVRIEVAGLSDHSDADVMIAVVEDNLVSKVERGENAGRTLSHTAVVRALQRVGTVPSGAAQWSAEVLVPSNDSWKEPRLVAFVQDSRSRRVLAAGSWCEERSCPLRRARLVPVSKNFQPSKFPLVARGRSALPGRGKRKF